MFCHCVAKVVEDIDIEEEELFTLTSLILSLHAEQLAEVNKYTKTMQNKLQ